MTEPFFLILVLFGRNLVADQDLHLNKCSSNVPYFVIFRVEMGHVILLVQPRKKFLIQKIQSSRSSIFL